MWWRALLVCLVLCIVLELTYSEEALSREERGARRTNRRRPNAGAKTGKNACKYEKPGKDAWGNCINGKRTVNVTLVRARRGQTCEPFKILEKNCRAENCRYQKKGINWSDCVSGQKTKVLTLISGANCNQTKTITKSCRQRAQRVTRDKGCKYERATWSDCINGKRTRTKTLKPGGPSTCQPQLVTEKNCKVKKRTCKYQPDSDGWGPCTSGQKVRTLNLKPGSPTECEATKTLRKRCKIRDCKYRKGTIGQCNQETGMLNRTDVLKDKMDASCPPTKVVQVPCNKPNSRPKVCQYGPWGQYGPCMNGVKRKSREIQMGQDNQQCQKKAVKIMACEDQTESQGGF